jgi:hypothetical protein
MARVAIRLAKLAKVSNFAIAYLFRDFISKEAPIMQVMEDGNE